MFCLYSCDKTVDKLLGIVLTAWKENVAFDVSWHNSILPFSDALSTLNIVSICQSRISGKLFSDY